LHVGAVLSVGAGDTLEFVPSRSPIRHSAASAPRPSDSLSTSALDSLLLVVCISEATQLNISERPTQTEAPRASCGDPCPQTAATRY